MPIDPTTLDPATRGKLRHFRYGHLPAEMQAKSKPFHDLAEWMVENLPQNPERTLALQKLLEAKDCAVRSALPE